MTSPFDALFGKASASNMPTENDKPANPKTPPAPTAPPASPFAALAAKNKAAGARITQRKQFTPAAPPEPMAPPPPPPTVSELASMDLGAHDFHGQPNAMPSEPLAIFRDNLAKLQNLQGTQDLPNALRQILQYLHDQPELKDQLAPEDIGLMVRSLRGSYGIAIRAKTTNKSKAKARNAKAAEVDAALDDLGF